MAYLRNCSKFGQKSKAPRFQLDFSEEDVALVATRVPDHATWEAHCGPAHSPSATKIYPTEYVLSGATKIYRSAVRQELHVLSGRSTCCPAGAEEEQSNVFRKPIRDGEREGTLVAAVRGMLLRHEGGDELADVCQTTLE